MFSSSSFIVLVQRRRVFCLGAPLSRLPLKLMVQHLHRPLVSLPPRVARRGRETSAGRRPDPVEKRSRRSPRSACPVRRRPVVGHCGGAVAAGRDATRRDATVPRAALAVYRIPTPPQRRGGSAARHRRRGPEDLVVASPVVAAQADVHWRRGRRRAGLQKGLSKCRVLNTSNLFLARSLIHFTSP